MLELLEEMESTNLITEDRLPERGETPSPSFSTLSAALQSVHDLVAPLWPLEDYVAVNPFSGYADLNFLETRKRVRSVRSGDLLLPLEHYRNELFNGKPSRADVADALEWCQQTYPQYYGRLTLHGVFNKLEWEPTSGSQTDKERQFLTAADLLDRATGSNWSTTIVEEISRHCAAHYDRGQASWPSPWKHLPLYQAWRKTASVDARMDRLGARGFRSHISVLPDTAKEAIAFILAEWKTPETHLQELLLSQAYSINGWASYIRYRVRQAEMAGQTDDDLTGLLAIRLAYDAALVKALGHNAEWVVPELGRPAVASVTPDLDVLVRYLMLVATEKCYRKTLCEQLVSTGSTAEQPDTRKTAQLVFCIDVRSEVYRRHLEAVSDRVQTFGFAGFFGMPIEYIRFGAETGVAQCPVLISPSVTIKEQPQHSCHKSKVSVRRRQGRLFRKVWKRFQTSAASCFSFVESFGLWYAGRLCTDAFGWTRPVSDADKDGLPKSAKDTLRPDMNPADETGLTNEQRIALAEGALRNLGLTSDFARLVVLCGHGSETVNNPYKAGLDCGACGGHSGEPNARLAAMLLNDSQVRSGLRIQGIDIPDDTRFLAAAHNTTTDSVQFFDLDQLPTFHAEDLKQLQNWMKQATNLTRAERMLRMDAKSPDQVPQRSRDWAEVRPEWGLAGNAAFIAAPRSRTAGLNLQGRSFLHDYEYEKDTEGKVLELILTAPVVVANWINMQYYVSAVDNENYGSGNKTIHNIVGNLGILEGNTGDLKTGLPWQSVHDGKQFQHDPVRLSVIIEAPRHAVMNVLDTHKHVYDLAVNGWICLLVLEKNQFFRFSQNGWEEHKVQTRD